jgi:multisubunit Na+/H+ antiporter MnhB subunit
VQVNARGEAQVTLSLGRADVTKVPVETKPQPRAIVGWSLAGLAGAALITSGITALRAKTLSDEYGDPASAHFQEGSARSEGITFRTAADVALSVALLSGAAAVVLLFTDLGKGSSDVARSATLRW